MSVKEYNKLIRDDIPDIIREQGKEAVVRVLDSIEYKKFLDAKLSEELDEYLGSDEVEELADLFEVILAILKYKGVSPEEFELIRKEKASKRGAFDKRLLLKKVIEK